MPILERDKMTEINPNQPSLNTVKKQEVAENVETGGVIASNTPSPLFNAAPASAETAGTIASSSSSSSGGSSINCVC